ncbi:MAG: hypothetical protein RL641_878 [Candidatus Parcubacteria bacterium]|jgi:hypothetical protein
MARFFKLFLFVALLVIIPHTSKAATLYFSPASGSYAVGDTFSVAVYTSSTDQSMNAMSGTVSFPTNILTATSVSKSGSIASLWAVEPSFSNSSGKANFEAVILNPGYIGNRGKTITINFKVKASGTAQLSISGGSVLANDGSGTEIYTGSSGASFSFAEAKPKTEPKPETKVETKPKPTPEPQTTILKPAPEIEKVEVIPETYVPPVVEIPQNNQVETVPTPISFWDKLHLSNSIIIFFILLLVFLILYFWHKYIALRNAVRDGTVEEEREKNQLYKFLNMDIAERVKIIKKLKHHKKLTTEERRIVLEVEKEHEDKE